MARYLTDEQIEHFLTRGYIRLRDCFSPEFAKEHTDRAWVRMGYDPNDRSTWKESRIHMPSHQTWHLRDFSIDAWRTTVELLGGEDRIQQPVNFGDSLIANLGVGANEPWQPASANVGGWHKDGDFFLHFLDSPDQGLLSIVLWNDVVHQGGPTYIACDSIGVIAKFLAQHPEGVEPGQFKFTELIKQCTQFEEATGKPGDIFLLHPYMLHATSQNVLRVPRFITNPVVHLQEPMDFNRANPADFSFVERAVLRGLNVERYDFRPTNPRRKIIPERVRIQQKMLEEEKARLAARV